MKKFVFLFLLFPFSAIADDLCLEVLKQHEYVNEQGKIECLWNEKQTAFAFCIQGTETNCFVVDSKQFTDVSKIQKINLGKLGLLPKNEYLKVTTNPKEWLSSKENTYLITFETQAWKNKQRYTTAGPAAVVNGEYRAQ